MNHFCGANFVPGDELGTVHDWRKPWAEYEGTA